MLRRTCPGRIAAFNCQPKMSWQFTTHGSALTEKALSPISKVEKTTTSNGIQVVSHDLNDPVSIVGIYNTKCGAKFDPRAKPGLNFVMRCSLMQSNMESSAFQFDKLIRSAGGSFEHQELRKKYLGWKLEVKRDSYQPILNYMCNGIAAPRFQHVEIDRYRDQMDNIYEELRFKTPRKYCIERLEQLAFYKEPLGQPRYVLPTSNDYCSPETLIEHYSSVFGPENVMIVGLNVNHNDLLTAYEGSQFKLSSTAPHFKEACVSEEALRINRISKGESQEKNQYHELSELVELEKRHREMTTNPLFIDETIFAIGWCTNGIGELADYAATMVALQYLDIFLGKSGQQRDTRKEDIQPFFVPYETAGLIGMTVRAHPGNALGAQQEVLKIMESVSSTPCHEQAVQKAVLRFHHDHLELRRDYVDFLATYGASVTPSEIIAAIQGVTLRNVKKVFEEGLSRRPSLFATGTKSTLKPLRKLL